MARDGIPADERRRAMMAVNPAFIPRNHLVEEVINAAVEDDGYQPLENLLTVLAAPYDDRPEFARYTLPPRPEQVVHQTRQRNDPDQDAQPECQQEPEVEVARGSRELESS